MGTEIYQAIAGWAGISTWFTYHPNDQARFYEAITKLHRELGSRVNETNLRDAIKKHRDENPGTLDGSPSDKDVDRFVQDTMTILNYLRAEGL